MDKSSAIANDKLFSSGNSLAVPYSKDVAVSSLTAEFDWDRGPNNDAENTLDSEDATPNPSYVNTYLREGTLGLRCKQFSVTGRLLRKFGCGTFNGILDFQTESR